MIPLNTSSSFKQAVGEAISEEIIDKTAVEAF